MPMAGRPPQNVHEGEAHLAMDEGEGDPAAGTPCVRSPGSGPVGAVESLRPDMARFSRAAIAKS